MKIPFTLPPLAGWRMVAQSKDLKPGQIIEVKDFVKPLILLRTASGKLRATSLNCPHLGASLATGQVDGEELVCPLHAWKFDLLGHVVTAPGYCETHRRLKTFYAMERYGNIFVALDTRPTGRDASESETRSSETIADLESPSFQTLSEKNLYFRTGGSLEVDCPWHVIACNGYDVHHFRTIHNRAFHTAPQIGAISASQFKIEIHAKVLGTTARDNLIRKLSNDSIRICIVNHGGSLLTVESDLGFIKTYLLLSLTPLDQGRTRVRYSLGIPKGPSPMINRLRHAFSLHHAQRFLKDDILSLAGANFNPKMLTKDDEHLLQFFEWLGKQNAE